MSPLSRISAGSFFSGYVFEYSSFGWPGTTVVGTNSILSIKPSSIAAMRTLRANGEAGEKVSFMGFPKDAQTNTTVILRCALLRASKNGQQQHVTSFEAHQTAR